MNRRRMLGGVLAALALSPLAGCGADPASGRKGQAKDPAEDPALASEPVKIDALATAMETVLAGSSLVSELRPWLEQVEEMRQAALETLPATAAVISATMNDLALPLVQGMAEVVTGQPEDEAGALSLMRPQAEAARAGVGRLEALLPEIEAELRDADLLQPVDPEVMETLHEAMTASHQRALQEIDGLGVRERPVTRSLLAGMHRQHRMLAEGSPTASLAEAEESLGMASAVAALQNARRALGGVRPPADECDLDDEAWFWISIGRLLFSFVGLFAVALTGASAVASAGILAGIVTAALSPFLALSVIWVLLILYYLLSIANQVEKMEQQVVDCFCGGGAP